MKVYSQLEKAALENVVETPDLESTGIGRVVYDTAAEQARIQKTATTWGYLGPHRIVEVVDTNIPSILAPHSQYVSDLSAASAEVIYTLPEANALDRYSIIVEVTKLADAQSFKVQTSNNQTIQYDDYNQEFFSNSLVGAYTFTWQGEYWAFSAGGSGGGSSGILEFHDHTNIPAELEDGRTYSIDLSGGTGNYTFKLPTLSSSDSFSICVDVTDIGEGVSFNLTGDGTQEIGAYGKELTDITDGFVATKFWVNWDGTRYVYSDTYYPNYLNVDATKIPTLDDLGVKSRNLLINGGRRFYARGTTNTLTSSSHYRTADRFRMETSGAGVAMTVDKVTDTPLPNLVDSSDVFTCMAANSVAGLFCHYRMEAMDARDLVGQTITFSVYAKVRNATTLRLKVYTPASSTPDTWENDMSTFTDTVQKEEMFSIPVSDQGKWLRLSLTMEVPQDGAKGLAFALENAGLSPSQNVTTTAWQVEYGNVASSFKHCASYAAEQTLCLRYYEKTDYGIVLNLLSGGSAGGTVGNGDALGTQRFLVRKRKAPHVTTYFTNGTNPNTVRGYGGVVVNVAYSTFLDSFNINNNNGAEVAFSAYSFIWDADAEL